MIKYLDENMVLFNDAVFFLGKSRKFDKDFFTVVGILEKDELNENDRFQLINIYKSAYHEEGKIAGVTSFDSSATNCPFCKKMQAASEKCPAHICADCYDKAQEQYKINSLNRHSLNMLIMMTVRFTDAELAKIPAGMINRIDSAGDIPNQIYAENMIRIAKVNSSARFAFWAKNTADLIAATDLLGKPENAVYIQSSQIIGRPAKKAKHFDYVFTVYPDKESTEKAIKEGAAECNGKKCRDCGYKCYFGTHEGNGNIAELLRGVKPERRAAIIEWLANN